MVDCALALASVSLPCADVCRMINFANSCRSRKRLAKIIFSASLSVRYTKELKSITYCPHMFATEASVVVVVRLKYPELAPSATFFRLSICYRTPQEDNVVSESLRQRPQLIESWQEEE